jgi:hypothetical protein
MGADAQNILQNYSQSHIQTFLQREAKDGTFMEEGLLSAGLPYTMHKAQY